MHGDKTNGRFIDPEEVDEISVEQKEYLLKTGYRPYMTVHGCIKWITPGQHGYKSLKSSASGHSRRPLFERIFTSRLAQVTVIFVALGVIALVLYLAMNLF